MSAITTAVETLAGKVTEALDTGHQLRAGGAAALGVGGSAFDAVMPVGGSMHAFGGDAPSASVQGFGAGSGGVHPHDALYQHGARPGGFGGWSSTCWERSGQDRQKEKLLFTTRNSAWKDDDRRILWGLSRSFPPPNNTGTLRSAMYSGHSEHRFTEERGRRRRRQQPPREAPGMPRI